MFPKYNNIMSNSSIQFVIKIILFYVVEDSPDFMNLCCNWLYCHNKHRYGLQQRTNNSTDFSNSREATSCEANQEFPNISRNLKDYYSVNNSPPPVPILSQINPVHTTPSYLTSILILSFHLCLCLLSGLLPSGFRTKILYAWIFSLCVLYALPISSSLTWSF
jgi:hypothetical protein